METLMIRTRLICLTLAIAFTLQLSTLPRLSHGKDPEESALVTLFNEMAAERSSIQRYVVECSFVSEGIREYPTGLEITFEYSNPDDHFVIVYDYANCKEEDRKPAAWLGRSGLYYISGIQGRDSLLSAWKDGDDPYKSKPHFDLMALGFGFMGDLQQGTSFATLTGNLERFSDPLGLRVSGDAGIALIMASKFPKPRIVVDRRRGSWPIKSDLDHAIWKLKLEEHAGTYTPSWFEFTRLDTRRQPDGKLTATLNWRNVNEEFSVGREAAARIAAEYGCNFKAFSDATLFRTR